MRRTLFESIVRRPLTEAAPPRDDAMLAELAAKVDQAARRSLGHSLAIREVDAGSCNGCELDIGKRLGADLVLTAWVQKVSNLILNINIEIKEVASSQTILNKSVDIRGNTDQSWSRGISYMVRGMVEKKQGGNKN